MVMSPNSDLLYIYRTLMCYIYNANLVKYMGKLGGINGEGGVGEYTFFFPLHSLYLPYSLYFPSTFPLPSPNKTKTMPQSPHNPISQFKIKIYKIFYKIHKLFINYYLFSDV